MHAIQTLAVLGAYVVVFGVGLLARFDYRAKHRDDVTE